MACGMDGAGPQSEQWTPGTRRGNAGGAGVVKLELTGQYDGSSAMAHTHATSNVDRCIIHGIILYIYIYIFTLYIYNKCNRYYIYIILFILFIYYNII